MRVLGALLLSALAVVGCDDGKDYDDDAVPAASPPAPQSVAEAVEDTVAPPSYEKPVVETAELMKLLVDPIYEELKDAIENPPEGRKEWRALYIAAFNLAEVNNLLFSRDDEDYHGTQEWIDESLQAQRLGIELGEAIKTQSDYEVLKEKYLAVMNNCNQCHRVFEPGEVDEIVPPTSWDEEVEEDPDRIVIQ